MNRWVTMLLLGGLRWRETDLAASDHSRNLDRRCHKLAKSLPVKIPQQFNLKYPILPNVHNTSASGEVL